MGHVVGLTSLSLTGPRHVSQRAPKFARKLVTCRLRGEVFALSEMLGHMSLSGGFYAPFEGVDPGMAGLEDCGGLLTFLKTKRTTAEEYPVRDFLSTQRAVEGGDLDTAFWLPGVETPADGLTKVRSDMVPLLGLLESGRSNPGSWRPLKGVAWRQGNGRV